MKEMVELYGLDREVGVDMDKLFVYTTSSGETYEKAFITEDGDLIAFDEAITEWVRLGSSDIE